MKKLVCITVVLAAFVALADRSDLWSANSVIVRRMIVEPLPDGGCTATAVASYTLTDAGSFVIETSRTQELSGANRTTGLDALAKGLILFKADKGL